MKQYRLKQLDMDLLYIQQIGDNKGINIDGLPEWIALCGIVTAYHIGDRRYSKGLILEYGKARQTVMAIIGG